MTVKKAETPKSIGTFIRISVDHHAHLVRKSKNNPDNKHNFVQREINDLIAEDFERMKKRVSGNKR